jgi:hypothetical protein
LSSSLLLAHGNALPVLLLWTTLSWRVVAAVVEVIPELLLVEAVVLVDLELVLH